MTIVKTQDLLIEGTLEMKLLNQPTPQGWQQILGIAMLELSVTADIIDAPASKDRGTYGIIPASVAKPKPSEIKLKLSRTKAPALAFGLMSGQTSASQSAGTLAAQPVTVILGQGVEVGKRGITAGTVIVKSIVVSPAVAVTYVEGTDYTFDYQTGTLYALESGAITDASSVSVSGSYTALTWNEIDAAENVQWNCALRLAGINLADSSGVEIVVPTALLTADGPIDFMSDKFIDLSFTGRANGKPPYTLRHGISAA